MTSATRMKQYRARLKERGLYPITGIYARREYHDRIRQEIRELIKELGADKPDDPR